ncbi:hypothetical protein C0Q70_09669 [Pomacea canaliculata]|uniref:Integrase zinc-binding domain-containing protein n=1 Tax=Pomacea canaliculata TaxID=400727 RepID=A0A2T7PAG4_POMCA|nr:hypothetical protein C0Q70_09669 [Pomacea canaliculata]
MRAAACQRSEEANLETNFHLQQGMLIRSSRTTTGTFQQVVVPQTLRASVLCAAHDGLLAGHAGVRATLNRVLANCWWPGVKSDTRKYCQTCDACQKTVAHGRNRPVPLVHVPVIDEPFKRVAIDIMGPIHPSSNEGHTHVLSIIDMASRYPEAIR